MCGHVCCLTETSGSWSPTRPLKTGSSSLCLFYIFHSFVVSPQMEDNRWGLAVILILLARVRMWWCFESGCSTWLCGCDFILRVQKRNTCLSWTAWLEWADRGASLCWDLCVCVCLSVCCWGTALRNVHNFIPHSFSKGKLPESGGPATYWMYCMAAVKTDFKSQAVTLEWNS